ncbi:hypothetical protein LTR36_008701 [Oleoguttula mirabilis]|uniref:Nudix hydrolase domain-containing protein n=1 Tax=Oleoguttula mirabilis TaxID=1507867 RepID=A0AAV9JTE5_9PEZI|nr:hypothetical protein LTR36_008701 [Oleoguttula mirabilis]
MSGRKTTYLDLVRAVDNFPQGGDSKGTYYGLYLPYDDTPHGYMLPETVMKMPWTQDFRVQHEHPRRVTVLDPSGGGDTAALVNRAFEKVVSICIDDNLFHVLDGKHSESFAILGANYPVHVERFASSLFGVTACGAHLVAYMETDEGLKLWIPRRAAHLYTSPGLLDTTVAGGVKAGVSPLQTIINEANEEASLPEDLVRKHVCARGVITIMGITGPDFPGEQGLCMPDVIYVYDLELPETIIPKPQDDEVEEFYCMNVEEVQRALLQNEFKPDSAAVLVEFLMRHGIITPESEPDYVEISMHLHRRLPFRVAPG